MKAKFLYLIPAVLLAVVACDSNNDSLAPSKTLSDNPSVVSENPSIDSENPSTVSETTSTSEEPLPTFIPTVIIPITNIKCVYTISDDNGNYTVSIYKNDNKYERIVENDDKNEATYEYFEKGNDMIHYYSVNGTKGKTSVEWGSDSPFAIDYDFLQEKIFKGLYYGYGNKGEYTDSEGEYLYINGRLSIDPIAPLRCYTTHYSFTYGGEIWFLDDTGGSGTGVKMSLKCVYDVGTYYSTAVVTEVNGVEYTFPVTPPAI